jgi:methyl-accepting chemotaxis protein
MNLLSLAGEDMSRSIQSVGEQANDAADHAKFAADNAEKSTEAAEALTIASREIIAVIELIRAIATKTNLLALNATIEAARAGDQGKGFAVVASEVKDLANQTARAVDTVTEHISAIRAAANTSSSTFYSISSAVNQIDQAASRIALSVTDQSARAMGISENVQMAARGSEETAQTVALVSDAAVRTDQIAKNVRETSRDLHQHSSEIRRRITDFLSDVRTA